MASNLFEDWPSSLSQEVFTDLLKTDNVRIERIISKGQTSPEKGWYQQEQGEWVIVLQGKAELTFEDQIKTLEQGDYLNIPAGVKHKVSYTSSEPECVWLAVFYR